MHTAFLAEMDPCGTSSSLADVAVRGDGRAARNLRQLQPRLLASEQVVSCTQQTTLSWQLLRE